jgi:hypothetical protein
MSSHPFLLRLSRLAAALTCLMILATVGACAPTTPRTPDEQIVDSRVDYMRWNLDPGSNTLYYWTQPYNMDRAQADMLYRSAVGYFEEGNYVAASELFDHVGKAFFNQNGTPRWPRDKQYALTSYYYAWAFQSVCAQDPEYCAAFIRLKGEQNIPAGIDARVLEAYLSALEAPLPADFVRHAVKSCGEKQKDLAVSMKAPPRLSAIAQARYQTLVKAKCE